jgi:transcription initiation factor TFIIH subunit 1
LKCIEVVPAVHTARQPVMAVTKAATLYKKQEGTLSFDNTKHAVVWAARATATGASISIALADVTNLQQTPATNPKVALRIVVQASTASTPENYQFAFTSKTAARDEQVAITDALRNAISAIKAGAATAASGTSAAGTPAGNGQPAALAIASAVTSGAKAAAAADTWYDDQKLKTNHELQQSLLRKDLALRERFEQSLKDKPDSITNGQFALQFWSARIHLLRAHAIERSQMQGTYNVLAEVKPKIVDGVTRLNLSKEQIQLIFTQHPLVKQVYNEVVPGKLSEMEFWARFFVSKLFKKLKGERLTDADNTDNVLDKYLNMDEDTLRKSTLGNNHIPNFIDLEGNEQNHSQRRGNRPDFDMRPNASDKVPILRALNNMSEKMMAHIAQTDSGMYAPVGMDEETYNQLRLRDLQAEDEEDRVVLTIADQRTLFGNDDTSKDQHVSAEAAIYARQDPSAVLSSLNASLSQSFTLAAVANLAETDTAGTAAATKQIMSLIDAQRNILTSNTTTATSITPNTMQSLLLTHNTTTEFLHYFWTLLLTPDTPTARRDLPSLLTTLTNSLARIDAVAAEAEKERQVKIGEVKKRSAEFLARTGKKMRVDEGMIGVGGKTEVEKLMARTVGSIGVARSKWEGIVKEAA